jgi:TrmH family RNA methyltransferase
MPALSITSLQNPRVKHTVKLRDRRARDQSHEFIIEGYRGILRATGKDYPLKTVFFCPDLFQGENEHALLDKCANMGAELVEVPAHVFTRMAYRDRPEGLLAVAPQIRMSLAQLEDNPSQQPFYMIAERIEKPGNLGTMMRSADATGVDAILLCDKCTDLFNPNVVRASTGTLFSVPVAEATPEEALSWLRRKQCRILAATPHATTRYDLVELTGPVAVVMGSEQYGLSNFWLENADTRVRIPMLGMADSLNVATATTLLLYEVLRQRLLAGAVLCE